RLRYGSKADVFFPVLPTIMGAKDGRWFAANVHCLGVLGMHQNAVRIVRRIGRQMSPGGAPIISAVHSRLIRPEKNPPRCHRADAEAGCPMAQRCDLALLPRLTCVGAAQGTHPIMHAYVEFALVLMCVLHSALL